MVRTVVTEDALLEILNRRLRADPECHSAEIVRLGQITGTPNWEIEQIRFESGADAECQRIARLIADDVSAHFDVAWPDA